MKSNYNINVNLQCITCGGGDFEFSDDKSYVKCKLCNKEYHGGYDQLVEMNQESINREIHKTKNQIAKDFKEDIVKQLKDAFRGSKHIKFK